MRSYLTRGVFRQLLNNVLFADSRKFTRPAVQCCSRYVAIPYFSHRRCLFGLSGKPKRQAKPLDRGPGFELILELCQALDLATRTPPPIKVAQAFCDFFQARMGPADRLEDIQALHISRTFQHLQNTYKEVEDFGVPDEILRVALQVLGNVPKGQEKYPSHSNMAAAVFSELQQRNKRKADSQEPQISTQILFPFIRALANTGEASTARGLVEKYWYKHLEHHHSHAWLQVLGGFAREDNSEEVSKTVDIMQKHNVSFSPKVHQFVTLYYAQRGDVDKTKKWYEHPIANSQLPTFHTDSRLLMFCIRHNELEWGDPIFKAMLVKTPNSKKEWSLIFQWAAAKGKGVDEIERMMKVMIRRTTEGGTNLQPDIEMINRLVELANFKNDPYSAERYVALGEKWGIQPDAQTFLLQLEYRIKVGDLDGARLSYSNLRAQEISGNKDIPMINKLVVALCAEKHPNHAAIMKLVEDLNERKFRFASETVVALSRLHLHRSEMLDLVDLLHTHAFHYGFEERASIRNVLADFCFDRSKSTARIWDAYNVLRGVFDETGIDVRTKLMNEFFERGRCDMACHVFGHMRQQAIKAQRPNIDTYVACFEGIAKSVEPEWLQNVHNMLKLDVEIEPNTRLYNSLMLAYNACDRPYRSLGFWADIVYSREGPTYSSIQIALRACEKKPFGEKQGREIWDRLKKYNIEVTREIYAAYIGVLASEEKFSECMKLLDEAEKEVGYPPDILM